MTRHHYKSKFLANFYIIIFSWRRINEASHVNDTVKIP